MGDPDKRRTTSRRRGELKDVDDKKRLLIGAHRVTVPSGPRSKRKAPSDAHAEENEGSQPQADGPGALAPPAFNGEAPSDATRLPRADIEDEISLKPATLKREKPESSSMPPPPLPPPGSIPSLASLAQKEISKDTNFAVGTTTVITSSSSLSAAPLVASSTAGGIPPPPPPPPLSRSDKGGEEESGGRKLKRSRGKDFPEPAPSVPVGKPWMSERDVLGPLMYHPGDALGDLDESIGKIVQVYCPARFLTLRNAEVMHRHVWGSHPEGYTDDSDVVCMLIHSSLVSAGEAPPTDIAGVIAYIKVIPGLSTYPSAWDSSRYKLMKSRKWTQAHPVALRVERVELLEREHLLRTTYTLPPRPDSVVTPRRAPPQPESDAQSSEPEIALKGKQDHDDEDDEHVHEAMHSLLRKKERGHGRKDRVLGDTVVMYNFSNEICKKYTLATVMDKGLEQQHWTAFRLKHLALYFENSDARYELSRLPPSPECTFDLYRWSRVSSPLLADLASVPLPTDFVQVLEDKLDWNEIQWGPTGCDVRGKSYLLKKVFWRRFRTVTPPPLPPEVASKAPTRKQKTAEISKSVAVEKPQAAEEPKKEEAESVKDGEAASSGTLVHLRRAPKKKKGKD